MEIRWCACAHFSCSDIDFPIKPTTVSKENTNNCLSVLKLSHLLFVFPPPGVFFVLDERRDMVFNPRERSECACAYFYSDPLFERKKLFAYYCAVQARGGRRNARVASCSSNRPRRKKESDRITDPLFQRKSCFFGEKVRHPKCFHFIHIFMRN